MKADKFALVFGLALALGTARAEDSDDHAAIEVSVSGGQIGVSEDPVSTSPSEHGLVWVIASDGFRFSQNGIDIAAPGVHDCHLSADGQRVHCHKNRHVAGTKFKYTVNVVDGSGQPLPPLDPFILHK
jgi:hypothetical protein